MAVIKAYTAVDMREDTYGLISDNFLDFGTITQATRSHIQVSYSGDVLNYYGKFSYQGSGSAVVSSFNYISSGTTLVEVSQLKWNIFADNADDESYMLRKSDTIFGSNDSDILLGYAGDDFLDGGAGGDALYGDEGNDILIGGAGLDSLNGGSGVDTASYLSATAGVNVDLTIAGFQDTVSAGIDVLNSIENLTGSNFDDGLSGDGGKNVLKGEAGDDLLVGGAGNDSLHGGDDNDTLVGDADNDSLYGDEGDDLLKGGAGDDRLYGGEGSDTASYTDATGAVTVDLNRTTQNTVSSGKDYLNSIENTIGSDHDDTLLGNKGNNIIMGGLGHDLLNGGRGDDVLDGGVGVDTADYSKETKLVNVDLNITTAQDTVSAGFDTLQNIENVIGSKSHDTLTGNGLDNVLQGGRGNDILDGGAGNDTADYSDSSGAVRVDLSLTGVQKTGSTGSDTLNNIENLIGSKSHDVLTGNNANNILEGGRGNDILDGGAGDDELHGGDGIDTASYLSATAGVHVDLNTAIAQELTAGLAAQDTLTSIENLTGSNHTDFLTGDNGDNILSGEDGNDFMSGGGGNDILRGGAGDDTLGGGEGDDKLYGGEGLDTVVYREATSAVRVDLNITTAQNTLGAGKDLLNNIEIVVGSDYDDVLIGNKGKGLNGLAGGFGNDLLRGGLGGDVLDGEEGSDTADYSKASRATQIDLNITIGQDTGSSGFDQLNNIENVIGSKSHDTLTGNGLDNVLQGGRGNDILDGGAGNDTADYSDSSGAVRVDLSLTGVQKTGSTGSDTLNNIENLIGSKSHDVLTGNNANNILEGGRGNDILDGGAGDDGLYGGDGIDTASYLSSTGGVTVDLTIAGSQDTVSAGQDLLDSIENLTGSNYDDNLTGNSGKNVLRGEASDDTLTGGLGDDKLYGGDGNDTASYADASGAVAVNLNTTKAQNTLSSGKDYLNSIENVTGSDHDDKLTGNKGNNILLGGLGHDVLNGGRGDDMLDGGIGIDTADYSKETKSVQIDLNITTAQDTVSAGFDTLQNIENVIGSKSHDTLTGNGLDNVLQGGRGNDILDGGAGNDTADYSDSSGAARVDLSLTGVQKTGSTGSDTLNNIENLIGSKSHDVLTGNSANNILEGGRGNDILDGGAGDDELYGNDGKDTLIGGAGNNSLYGGLGSDKFILDGQGLSNIIDFSSIEGDVLQLDQTAYTGLSETKETLDLVSFSSSDVLDFNDILSGPSILYEESTGDIYYDADGGTGFNAVHIASVTDGLLLTNTDFDLV